MGKVTIADIVLEYLTYRKVAVKKHRICIDLDLKKSSVDKAITKLHKAKKVGRYGRSYWQVRT